MELQPTVVLYSCQLYPLLIGRDLFRVFHLVFLPVEEFFFRGDAPSPITVTAP
jgi:hypothetical protein